jgi:hypothetical protein
MDAPPRSMMRPRTPQTRVSAHSRCPNGQAHSGRSHRRTAHPAHGPSSHLGMVTRRGHLQKHASSRAQARAAACRTRRRRPCRHAAKEAGDSGGRLGAHGASIAIAHPPRRRCHPRATGAGRHGAVAYPRRPARLPAARRVRRGRRMWAKARPPASAHTSQGLRMRAARSFGVAPSGDRLGRGASLQGACGVVRAVWASVGADRPHEPVGACSPPR